MKVYVDGGSTTHGAELDKPEEERYGALVADYLNGTEHNFADVGASNGCVARHLLSENDIQEYGLAVIALTFPSRMEWYNPDDKRFQQIQFHSVASAGKHKWGYPFITSGATKVDVMTGSLIDKTFKDPEGKLHFTKSGPGGWKSQTNMKFWCEYYKRIYTPQMGEAYEKMWAQAIVSHCKANDVPLILITDRGMVATTGKAIAADPFTGVTDNPLFMLDSANPKYPRAPKGHPDKVGHRMIAEDIIAKYEALC